jgi:hypothetical protein
MKRRLLAATGLLGLTIIGDASLYAAAESPKRDFDLGSGPVTEQKMRDKLAAAGFSNIRINPRNFFDTVATRDGRTLSMVIDPQSGTAIRIGNDDDADDPPLLGQLPMDYRIVLKKIRTSSLHLKLP